MIMRKLFTLMMLLIVSFVVNATPSANPYELIQQVANTTFQRIQSENQMIQQDPQRLKRVLREELMPYVNHKLAAKILLEKTPGTAEQKMAFYQAFEQYLVTTYATVFKDYADQKLIVEPQSNADQNKVVTVKTRLVEAGKPDTHIDFKVRLKSNSHNWAVYDMVVEGVSLLNSKKAELRSILRQDNGIDTATRLLNEKSAKR
jgi:phospholipid transport system substrate-binding protein